MNEEPEQAADDEQSAGTDGPGSVSVDEPTQPALKETDQDEFDKQADKQEREE